MRVCSLFTIIILLEVLDQVAHGYAMGFFIVLHNEKSIAVPITCENNSVSK